MNQQAHFAVLTRDVVKSSRISTSHLGEAQAACRSVAASCGHRDTHLVVFAGNGALAHSARRLPLAPQRGCGQAYMMTDSLTSFFVDQAVHLAALVGLVAAFPGAVHNGWWGSSLNPELRNWYLATLSCLSGLILVVPAGGILIGKATRRFLEEIGENNIRGLKKGGQYIGSSSRIALPSQRQR